MDEHFIPEPGKRDQDLLLCVLVLQKGVLPTIRTKPLAPSPTPPPPPPPASAPSSSQTSFLSNIPNQSALQHLLSNPSTLSSLTTSESQSVLNLANSQQSLPLSIPTGPRSTIVPAGGGGGSNSNSGPPIHPSRLGLFGVGGGENATETAYGYQGYLPPPPPTGPSRTISSGGGVGGGYNSQSNHFENNLTNSREYDNQNHFGMGDGGWENSSHHGQRGGYRGGGARGSGGGYRGRGRGY